MSRLTKEEILKFPKTTYGRALGKTIASKVMNELLQYKDLEEQIGCPLEVVAKAITYGIAYELKNGLIESEPHISLTECGYGYILCSGSSTRKVIENGEFQTKDYKKTWWLKENREE